MKIEASTRLRATTESAVAQAQQADQIDKTQVTAAAVPTATRIKLLKQLFAQAKLKRFGLVNDGEAITGDDVDRAKQIEIGKALATLGWATKWRRGVCRADGTWPLIMQADKNGALQIEVFNQDTVDKGAAKQAVKDYKSIVGEVATALKVKIGGLSRSPGKTGAGAPVRKGDGIDQDEATKRMKAGGYGKPTKKTADQLHFKTGNATIVLEWSSSDVLAAITCIVI